MMQSSASPSTTPGDSLGVGIDGHACGRYTVFNKTVRPFIELLQSLVLVNNYTVVVCFSYCCSSVWNQYVLCVTFNELCFDLCSQLHRCSMHQCSRQTQHMECQHRRVQCQLRVLQLMSECSLRLLHTLAPHCLLSRLSLLLVFFLRHP